MASRSTIARPMPWSPPVTAATFPSTRFATLLSLVMVHRCDASGCHLSTPPRRQKPRGCGRCQAWTTGGTANPGCAFNGAARKRREELVAGLCAERVEARMLQAVPANEMNHQEHQQAAAHHHRDCDLQGELHVVKVGNSAHQLRAESANQLRDKHVDADGSGMRPPWHHVVNDGGNRAVIPGHEKGGQRESCEYEHLLVGLYSQKKEGSGEQKSHGDGDDASEGEPPLQAIRDIAAEKNATKTTH